MTLVLGALGIGGAATAQDLPEEEITDLGTLGGEQSGAFGTNTDGSVTWGYAQDGAGTVRLVLWRNGVATDVTPTDATFSTAAFDRVGVRRFFMSRDGSTLVGYYVPPGGSLRAVVIRNGAEAVLTGASTIIPEAVSGNGLVLAGRASDAQYTNNPFYYDATGLHLLPFLDASSGSTGTATAVNWDGNVIVGRVSSGTSEQAVRWVSGNIQSLGALTNGTRSYAVDVSDDGNAVAGVAFIEASPGVIQPRGFIWRDGQMTSLGVLNNTGIAGNDQSAATAISGDGTTVIGHARMENPQGTVLSQGFVWRDGVIQNIGWVPTSMTQGSFSTVSAISFDGRAIAGQARSEAHPGGEAFRWYDGEITLLGTLGGAQSYSTDISDDGSTVVGVSANAAGQWHAFIWRTIMQDFTNILGSFAGLAEETELAMAMPIERLGALKRSHCQAGAKRFCLALGAYSHTGSAPGDIQRAEELGATISAGWRLHDLVSVGVAAGLADSNSGLDRLAVSDSWGWSTFVTIADHATASGPSLHGWYSRSHDRIDLNRTFGLDGVEAAIGESRLRGENYGARIVYGVDLSPRVTITPTASLSWFRMVRSAFDEDAVDFPASFDRADQSWTQASLGTIVKLAFGSGELNLAGSVELDLDRDPLTLRGRSELPGAETLESTSFLKRRDIRPRIGVRYGLPVGPVELGISAFGAAPEFGESWHKGAMIGVTSAF